MDTEWTTESGPTRPRGFASLLVGFVMATAVPAAAEPALTLFRADESAPPVEMTLAELEAMPQTTIETGNDYVDGVVAFRGPLARDVVAALDPDRSTVLHVLAADDYAIDILASDFFDYDVILAMEADGKRLSRREMGPLWLMYPMSDHPEFERRHYSDRLVWQVVSIEAR